MTVYYVMQRVTRQLGNSPPPFYAPRVALSSPDTNGHYSPVAFASRAAAESIANDVCSPDTYDIVEGVIYGEIAEAEDGK